MTQEKTDLGELLQSANGLNMENDLEYLLGLVGESIRNETEFENDTQRAMWVVSHWCQELQYEPNLEDYTVGEIVPIGTIPENRKAMW